MTFISYAQNFEDVILRRALQGVDKGFYMDVEAWLPDQDSVMVVHPISWTVQRHRNCGAKTMAAES